MRRSKRIRQRFETLGCLLARNTIPYLPRAAVVLLARALAGIVVTAAPVLRRIAYANMDLVFEHPLSIRKKRRLLRQAYFNFSLLILDMFWFSRHTRKRLEQWVTLEESTKVLNVNRAQICVTGHLGNWELLGMKISLDGHNLSSVAAPLGNPALNQLFIEYRQATGQRIIARQGALRGMLQCLRSGDKVAILLDQNTKIRHGGIFAPFFGLPVVVSPAVASLAYRTGAELVFGFCLPDSRGHYRAFSTGTRAFPHVAKPSERDLAEATLDILSRLEEAVKAHPEYWVWMYKRWKYVPLDTAPETYPFYAKPLPHQDIDKLNALESKRRIRSGFRAE